MSRAHDPRREKNRPEGTGLRPERVYQKHRKPPTPERQGREGGRKGNGGRRSGRWQSKWEEQEEEAALSSSQRKYFRASCLTLPSDANRYFFPFWEIYCGWAVHGFQKPVKKGPYPLRPGVEGFFLTCDGGRERQATREALALVDRVRPPHFSLFL